MNHGNARNRPHHRHHRRRHRQCDLTDSNPEHPPSRIPVRHHRQQGHRGGQGQPTSQRRTWEPPPGVARSPLRRQNTTRAALTTPYNANTHSSPGGTPTNANTGTTDSGNTATPPPNRSKVTLNRNRSNTCHYGPTDSRHHQDHRPAKHQPRMARPEPPNTSTQATRHQHQKHPRHRKTARHTTANPTNDEPRYRHPQHP